MFQELQIACTRAEVQVVARAVGLPSAVPAPAGAARGLTAAPNDARGHCLRPQRRPAERQHVLTVAYDSLPSAQQLLSRLAAFPQQCGLGGNRRYLPAAAARVQHDLALLHQRGLLQRTTRTTAHRLPLTDHRSPTTTYLTARDCAPLR
ncbi:MAG: hypothetical protein R3E31_16225 [Chloroflexota bacterium]